MKHFISPFSVLSASIFGNLILNQERSSQLNIVFFNMMITRYRLVRKVDKEREKKTGKLRMHKAAFDSRIRVLADMKCIE